MAYKCGNCNIDFPSLNANVKHMIDIHESPYVAGEERLIKMSQDYIGKMSDVNYIKQQNEEKVARMQKSFADNGVN